MRLSCEIVMDLLPLYEEGICSEETKKAVEEHLKECKKCRSFLEDVHSFPEEEIQAESVDKSQADADKVVVKSFKKIALRWMCSILIVAIVIPMAILGWNQYNEVGVHFTNLHELYIGKQFVEQLILGNYEEAFKYIDVESKKTELGEKELENVEDKMLEKFLESAEKLKEAGGIQEAYYKGVSYGDFHYQLKYLIVVDGKKSWAFFDVGDRGVINFGNDKSFLTDSFAYFGGWSELLWQDLNGCYYDPELKGYVYY